TFGVLRVIESATGSAIFPAELSIGAGKYALDLGVNVYGLLLCVAGYILGAFLSPAKRIDHESVVENKATILR
ncbi:MAG: hypothetical protein AAFY72_09455, partial [Cyanobacteria bacterium J06649_4]